MQIENRLQALSIKVKVQRENGSISSWPDEIKLEAVLLMAEVGIDKLIDSTKLPRSSVYIWRDKLKEIKHNLSKQKPDNDKILVTRISPPTETTTKTEPMIVMLEKNEIKIKFFCKNTSMDFLERLLK